MAVTSCVQGAIDMAPKHPQAVRVVKTCVQMFRILIWRLRILYNSVQILAGSLSAVSKRTFARKYAFENIFHALQDLHTFATMQSQKFGKNRFLNTAIFAKIQQHLQNPAN